MKTRGFTIFEILIVITLFTMLFAAAIPYSVESYRHYVLTTETKNMINVLRRAQMSSIANNYETTFGVAIQSTQTVLFRGTSYATRVQSFDEIYPKSEIITITAPSEIIFEQVSGRPNSASTITLSNFQKSQTITLNAQGAIDW